MQVTTNHAASSYGQPVILADDGSVMDYGPGIRAIQDLTGIDNVTLAHHCNVSVRTVEGWRQGRVPTAAALNVMGYLLITHPSENRKGLAGYPDPDPE